MSSVSEETNSTSGSKFIFGNQVSSVVSSKPSTTEEIVKTFSSQDDRLSQESSSKSVSSLPISLSPVTEKQHHGGIEEKKELNPLAVSLDSQFVNSDSENVGVIQNESPQQRKFTKKPCRFYESHGFCKFRRNCRYSHSGFVQQDSKYDGTESKLEAPETLEVTPEQDAEYQNTNTSQNEESICRFFARTGYCRYGTSCRFSHHNLHQTIQQAITTEESSPDSETSLKEGAQSEGPKTLKANPPVIDSKSSDFRIPKGVCRLFISYGDCRYGDSCKFSHIQPKMVQSHDNSKDEVKEDLQSLGEGETENQDVQKTYSSQSSTESQNLEKFIAPKPVTLRNKRASEMTTEDFQKLRKTEVNNLKRRFPKCTETGLPDVGTVFEIIFSPTDPDWRFDVKSVTINVMIPEKYPEEFLQVDLQNPDGVLPEKLIRYFNKLTFTWLQEQQEKNQAKDDVVLIFRPFLKWLDKSLEDIFIGGLKMVKREMEAKAAGIEFVTHEELNASNKMKENYKQENVSKPAAPEEYNHAPYEELSDPLTPEYEESMPHFEEAFSSGSVLMDHAIDKRSVLETAKRGTEIKFRNLELMEGAASLTCYKLSLTLQCGRCTLRSDIAVQPHRSHRVVCERCHHQQKLNFRPQMLHQFSTIAGYLDLDNCQVIDVPLLTCEFAVQCLPCGRQNFVANLQYGQRQTTWCLFCHSKLSVSIESVKLNQLQPSVEPVVAKVGQLLKLEKKEKKVKDPAIQEGKPLPENGTCKHYKKSFRWLRFPCCGKAYPCDHCHDEKESDHEMKFATRMICGFCAKEQPYSKDRACVSCASDMTKKTGSHWEGGRGCRDRIKMSRDDKQKYAGTNKTVSKKQQPAAKKVV